MAGSNIGDPPLTQAELREDFDRLRGELFRQFATEADVVNLKERMVGVFLVVALNVLRTARLSVTFLNRQSIALNTNGVFDALTSPQVTELPLSTKNQMASKSYFQITLRIHVY